MKNPVKKKKVFWIQVKLVSPLSISSGKGEETDSDVMYDYYGNPFVPAASLAGAMRAYLKKKKDEPCLLGYSRSDEEGNMSALFLSDMDFDRKPMMSVRDGVELDEKKTAVTGSKYDMEIIEAGAKASFYAELTIRGEDKEEAEYDRDFATIIKGLHTGEIRLGSKKTRGFGKVKICHIACRVYDESNYLKYADVYTDKAGQEEWKKDDNALDEWLALADKEQESQYLHLEVPLRLKGGISIRQYSARKGEPDFVHVVNRLEDGTDKAVIPGSSFTGAIRHRLKNILTGLAQQGLDINVSYLINAMFGYVKKEEAHVSAIVISESEIEGAKPLTMTRTGISRFESSARKKALFTEKTYVDGTLKLDILIRKGNCNEQNWMVGLLLLAVEDIRNGFLAVGGATAIGRGIFETNGDVLLDETPLNVHDTIGKAFKYLKGEMNV